MLERIHESGEPREGRREKRAIPPQETIHRVRPLLPIFGITRAADVTGLDTIGIPVVMVVRPNARSLSVAQGKGATLDAAKASGLMESIECWHAERIDQPLKLATYAELRHTHRLCDVAALPVLSMSRFHAHHRTLWIEGKNHFDGHSTWVPFEMVHMDYTLPLPSGSGSFLMSSSGLASGNTPSEALLHGLCELVERDALTLHRASSKEAQHKRRVDLGTVEDPVCRHLLSLYERAGVLVAAWEITSDVGIAAFQCVIVDRDPNPQRPIGPMGGYGCHPSRAVALSRALTEAAQSRLTVITGSRDDVRHHSGKNAAEDLALALKTREELGARTAERGFSEAPDFFGDSVEAEIQRVTEGIRGVGLGEIVVVDLSKPGFGVAVQRVLVPGLEPLHEVPGYTPGARARRRLAERPS